MKIKFLRNGLTVERDKPTALIDICYKESTPINFGCRIGVCGTCKVKIVSGIANVSIKNEQEELFTTKPDERLGCQCTIRGDVEIE